MVGLPHPTQVTAVMSDMTLAVLKSLDDLDDGSPDESETLLNGDGVIQRHQSSSAERGLATRFGFSIGRLKRALSLLVCAVFAQVSKADVIYLRNGKKLSVERAWEEGDRIRYERNGNVFGFSKTLVERIESGLYRPEPADIATPEARQRQQSVPVEVLDETLNLGYATGGDH